MLQQVRIKKGFSQSQLAKKCNIPLATLQKYEGGYANINHAKLETLLKLCIALDCNLKDIVTDNYLRVLMEHYSENKKEKTRK